jgi:peptidoglycan/xylan/chitin deacetylase (PgdA/CDA1 family)
MFRSSRLLQILLAAAIIFSAPSAGTGHGPIYNGPRSVPVVALTFDDGPHQFTTPRLIELLDRLSVKGTFFIVGSQAVQFPRILSEIVARGHSVANHSWSHRDITLLDSEDLFKELAYCSQAVEAIIGVRPRFFRPPGGRWDSSSLTAAHELGLTTILWDVSGRDLVQRAPQRIAASVIRAARPGSVVLLHGGLEWTMEALPLIVEGLRAKGFIFASLDQMLPFAPEAKVPLREIFAEVARSSVVHPVKVVTSDQ